MSASTKKIYYQNPYSTSINAQLLTQQEADKSLWIQTDQTIFYPGGGGQPADSGKINGMPVTEVKIENELIWHCLGPSGQIKSADQLFLELDWPRRYYHMQQHSGQHLLSHVLDDFKLKTVSVHLGEEYTMIEVEGTIPDEQTLAEIETKTNEIIRQARPVTSHWVDKKSISQFPLRKPAGNWKQLRVVEIEDCDFSACGGTHVNNTSEVGLIKILGFEKIRGHARIKALIGNRADRYFDQLHRMHQQVKTLLQTDYDKFAKSISDMQQELRLQKKEKGFYRSGYARYKSEQIINQTAADQQAILVELEDGHFEDAREIAKIIGNNFKRIAFIIFEQRFILCAGSDSGFDTNRFVKEYQDLLNLKGGGPPGLAQGKIGISDAPLIQTCLNTFIGQE